MAKTVILDEVHLTIRVPSNLPETQVGSVRRTLTATEFMGRLRRAIRAVVRASPELALVGVAVSR